MYYIEVTKQTINIKYNLSLKHRENHLEVLFLDGGIKFLLSSFNVPTSLQWTCTVCVTTVLNKKVFWD